MGALKDVLAKKAALDGNYNPSHAYEVYPDWHEKAGQRVAEEDMAELAEQEANRASHVDYKAREQARQKLAKLVQAMHDEVFVLQERMGDMERKLAEQRRVIVVNENKQELYASANAVHKAFAPVLKRLHAGCHVMLVGPTQCGKTTLAGQVAEALAVDYSANSMSAGTKESDLFGWLLPTGDQGKFEYHAAPFVNVFLNGGVQLFDEMDASDPNLLLAVNMALANGHMFVPHRLQGQHLHASPKFYAIAACNTWGTGADSDYVGRSQLDAATLARFIKVEVDYDMELEYQIANPIATATGHAIRANIRRHKLRRVLTTKTIQNWTKCVAAGIKLDECLTDFFLGWAEEERTCAMEKSKETTRAAEESAEARARAKLATAKAEEARKQLAIQKEKEREARLAAGIVDAEAVAKDPMAAMFDGLKA